MLQIVDEQSNTSCKWPTPCDRPVTQGNSLCRDHQIDAIQELAAMPPQIDPALRALKFIAATG